MGPGEYNSVANFNLDQGWDWMTANHGFVQRRPLDGHRRAR